MRAADLPLPVPARRAICLECRTALVAGETCDSDPRHPVTSFDEPQGRNLLVEATWGPPEVRMAEARMALHAEHAVSLLALFGFVGGLFALWLILPGLGPLHVLGAALTMAIFWGGGNLVLSRRATEFPVGARDEIGSGALALLPPEEPASDEPGPAELAAHPLVRRDIAAFDDVAPGRLGLRGVAAGAMDLEAPASGSDCLAYAIELHFVGYWGDRIMYRDAVTSGFDVLLEDGRIARVPSGRLRLLAPMRQVIDVDNLALERYLCTVDREHEVGRAFDPLRYNVVAEALLVSGDWIELVSRFEPVVNPRAAPTSYREPAPAVWLARGLPVLRLSAPR